MLHGFHKRQKEQNKNNSFSLDVSCLFNFNNNIMMVSQMKTLKVLDISNQNNYFLEETQHFVKAGTLAVKKIKVGDAYLQ